MILKIHQSAKENTLNVITEEHYLRGYIILNYHTKIYVKE